MTFFKNIKRSFGFADSSDEYDYEYEDAKDATVKKRENNIKSTSHIELSSQVSNKSSYNSNRPSYEEISPEEKMKQMQLQIFDGVVNLFNKSLPDFFKSCLDVEAQKQYIFDSLDKSLRNYITNISVEARQVCEARWDKERSKLMSEMIEIKSKYREIETTKDDWKRQQLSAERQKRALSTRLHDLEVQVASLEAEKEQYSLENKSLINKLKVSSMKDSSLETLQEEIDRLQLELKEAKSGASSFEFDVDSLVAEKDNEINNLKQELAAIKQDLNKNENTEYSSQIENLTKDNEELRKSLDQIKVKSDIADAMINDLKEKASTAMRQYELCQDEKNKLEQQANVYSSEIAQLTQQLTQLTKSLEAKDIELAEAKGGLEMIDTIQSEMDKFERIKKKKDSKIAELQNEIQSYKSQNSQLENDIESLKSTIENNLYNQAISENRLKKEIAKLKGDKEDKEDVQEVKISAIDESLDDADWLISIPPEGTQMRPSSSTSDDDFGYQEPTKKTTPNNEAQMSLW